MPCYTPQSEIEECCQNPDFCIVCNINRTDVPVYDNVCLECGGMELAEPEPEPEPEPDKPSK